MKLTTNQLKQIIKEELNTIIEEIEVNEGWNPFGRKKKQSPEEEARAQIRSVAGKKYSLTPEEKKELLRKYNIRKEKEEEYRAKWVAQQDKEESELERKEKEQELKNLDPCDLKFTHCVTKGSGDMSDYDEVLSEDCLEEFEECEYREERDAEWDPKIAPIRTKALAKKAQQAEERQEKFIDDLWEWLLRNTRKGLNSFAAQKARHYEEMYHQKYEPEFSDYEWRPPGASQIEAFAKKHGFGMSREQAKKFRDEAEKHTKEEAKAEHELARIEAKIQHYKDNPKEKILQDILKIAKMEEGKKVFKDVLGNDITIEDMWEEGKKDLEKAIEGYVKEETPDGGYRLKVPLFKMIDDIEDWLFEIYSGAEPGQDYHYNALQYITKFIEKQIWKKYQDTHVGYSGIHEKMLKAIGIEKWDQDTNFFLEMFKILNIPDEREWD